jgi:hypothetical protein
MFLRISANERGKREFSQNLSQPHRAAGLRMGFVRHERQAHANPMRPI